MNAVLRPVPVEAIDLAALVIESVGLEDVAVSDIDLDGPIYGEGLGLDSLDMLEISLAIQQRYGVRLKADGPDVVRIFASLRSLANQINALRG